MEHDVKFYESKLMPCPFCGGKAKIEIEEKENSDTTHMTHIRCEDTFGCGASIFGFVSYYAFERNMQELVDRWNTRGINKKKICKKEIATKFLNKRGITADEKQVDFLCEHMQELWKAWQDAGVV